GIVCGCRCNGFFDEPLDEGKESFGIFRHETRVIEYRLETEQKLAHEVVLPLHVGRVTDAYVTIASKACQVREKLFFQIPLPADSIYGLKRAGLSHIAQVS